MCFFYVLLLSASYWMVFPTGTANNVICISGQTAGALKLQNKIDYKFGSYSNFCRKIHTKLCELRALLRCKTRNDLNSITTNSGFVPKLRQIVAVLSHQRTAFERRPYGVYGVETLGFVQTFPSPCEYCFTSASYSLIQLSPVIQNLSNLHFLKSHTMISGSEKIHEAKASIECATNMYTTNTQLICGFVKILDERILTPP